MSAPKNMLCIPRRCRRLDERTCITKGFPRFHNNVSRNRQTIPVYPTVPQSLRGLRNSTTGMVRAWRVGFLQDRTFDGARARYAASSLAPSTAVSPAEPSTSGNSRTARAPPRSSLSSRARLPSWSRAMRRMYGSPMPCPSPSPSVESLQIVRFSRSAGGNRLPSFSTTIRTISPRLAIVIRTCASAALPALCSRLNISSYR